MELAPFHIMREDRMIAAKALRAHRRDQVPALMKSAADTWSPNEQKMQETAHRNNDLLVNEVLRATKAGELVWIIALPKDEGLTLTRVACAQSGELLFVLTRTKDPLGEHFGDDDCGPADTDSHCNFSLTVFQKGIEVAFVTDRSMNWKANGHTKINRSHFSGSVYDLFAFAIKDKKGG
jgi:hypothetical protein